nr:FtsW/RodA/SpoVE family cell cycle protein [Victivallales bacterium]
MEEPFEIKEPHWILLKIRSFDFAHFIAISILSITGLLFIYGIGQQIGGRIQDYWKMQALWFAIGFTSWFFFSFLFPPKQLKIIAPIIYVLSVIVLIAVLLKPGEVNMTKRWLTIAGFRFQPSEFGKTGAIVMLAWLLSLREFKVNSIKGLLSVCAIAGTTFLLICVEPDLGTAVVIIPVAFFMIFVAGLSWKWIIAASVAV